MVFYNNQIDLSQTKFHSWKKISNSQKNYQRAEEIVNGHPAPNQIRMI